MAGSHEEIVNKIMTDWSVQNRGRMFKNHTGGAWMSTRIDNEYFVEDKNKRRYKVVTLFNARFIKYGLRAKDEKLVDLIGFELVDNNPLWCVIEVKTSRYKKLDSHQIDCLNMAVMFGGVGYVAMETEDGYELQKWELKK